MRENCVTHLWSLFSLAHPRVSDSERTVWPRLKIALISDRLILYHQTMKEKIEKTLETMKYIIH